MKVSELIEKLEKLKFLHGDLPVFTATEVSEEEIKINTIENAEIELFIDVRYIELS